MASLEAALRAKPQGIVVFITDPLFYAIAIPVVFKCVPRDMIRILIGTIAIAPNDRFGWARHRVTNYAFLR